MSKRMNKETLENRKNGIVKVNFTIPYQLFSLPLFKNHI